MWPCLFECRHDFQGRNFLFFELHSFAYFARIAETTEEETSIYMGEGLPPRHNLECEEEVAGICKMSPQVIEQLVSHELYLLACDHDSDRCHAAMFFGLSFQFKIMLKAFDHQDGLRKMFNVTSGLPICAARQVIRHVCATLKKYFESHLFHKYNLMTRRIMAIKEVGH